MGARSWESATDTSLLALAVATIPVLILDAATTGHPKR